MILSKSYKNTMDKITVDEAMKKRILNNINNKKDKNHKKKYIPRGYRNFGIIAACCAMIIFSTNNKQILRFLNFDENYINKSDITLNESRENDEVNNTKNNNEAEQSRERMEADLKNDSSSKNITNNSKQNFQSSENNPSKVNDNNENMVEENNSNEVEQNDNKIQQNNTKENDNKNTEIETAQDNGISTMNIYEDKGRVAEKEFKNLDELKNSIDFSIKTPKVENQDVEIKDIKIDSNDRICIDYENKDYILILKIEKKINYKSNFINTQDEAGKLIKVNENDVLLKGNDGLINSASWNKENISYDIELTSGIKEEKIIDIIKNMK